MDSGLFAKTKNVRSLRCLRVPVQAGGGVLYCHLLERSRTCVCLSNYICHAAPLQLTTDFLLLFANMAANIIFQWLERIGLSYAIPMFQAEGIATPQALLNLDFNSYDRLGIVDVDDRKRLFELVHRVREVSER